MDILLAPVSMESSSKQELKLTLHLSRRVFWLKTRRRHMTSMETCFSDMETWFFVIEYMASIVLALGRIISHFKTPEQFYGLEIITRASINTVVSRKK